MSTTTARTDSQTRPETQTELELQVDEAQSTPTGLKIICWSLRSGTSKSLGVKSDDEELTFTPSLDNDGTGFLYASSSRADSEMRPRFIPLAHHTGFFPIKEGGRGKVVKGTLVTPATGLNVEKDLSASLEPSGTSGASGFGRSE